MKKRITYIVVLLAMLVFAAASCKMGTQKQMNKRVSLWRKDKIPYGTSVIYENLKYLFPKAAININTDPPTYYKWQGDTVANRKTVCIILAPRVIPATWETNQIFSIVASGCHVFIFSLSIGSSLLDSLHVKMNNKDDGFFNLKDSLQATIYDSSFSDTSSFAYPGYSTGNYFTKIDTSLTTIAGINKQGKANFICFKHTSGGSISFHTDPFVFTNFFILHKNNKAYCEKVFSWLPDSIKRVEWDDYFRNKREERSSFSSLGFLMKQPSFRFAIILTLIVCILAVLAEARRRQRIVPVIAPVRNSSLDFVKTVGRLYFQQKDHKNLAKKMIAHFLDHVRSRYNISTSVLDETWINKLSYKSGFDKQALESIVKSIKAAEQAASLSEAALFDLSKKLEQFYKS